MMRTTLTIDDDVAQEIARLRKARGAGLKQIINEALRSGVREMTTPGPRRPAFRTRSVSLGRAYLEIDNITETIAAAESERFG